MHDILIENKETVECAVRCCSDIKRHVYLGSLKIPGVRKCRTGRFNKHALFAQFKCQTEFVKRGEHKTVFDINLAVLE